MRILIGGASGLVGTALTQHLALHGHEVTRLVRGHRAAHGEIPWDPAAGKLDPDSIAGIDAVVNLSGENIASGPWSAKRKKRIRDSRIDATRTIVRAITLCPTPPITLLSASAVGYYGNTGDHAVDESGPLGTGFLAEVCRDWEAETLPAHDAGIRVVNMRLGVVLSTKGGVLSKMLLPSKLGLGASLGHGRQYMSWITLPDVARAMHFCLSNTAIDGPVNFVAPQPVTNACFTRALAAALHRPAFLAAPAFALRAALGEMADEMLLASNRVRPAALEENHFEFDDPVLDAALRRLLKEQL